MSMPDATRRLQAVIADPDNDTPRLAYADWLEAEGDADERLNRAKRPGIVPDRSHCRCIRALPASAASTGSGVAQLRVGCLPHELMEPMPANYDAASWAHRIRDTMHWF